MKSPADLLPWLFRIKLLFCLFCFPVIIFSQSPQPVVFKALPPPMSSLYLMEEAGLIGVANPHEIQLWDVRSKAYYGTLVVIAPEFIHTRISHVEYLKNYNKVAVVWEEKTTDPDTKEVGYRNNNLTLFDLATLQPDMNNSPYGSGMARLIKYKYGSKVAAQLRNEKDIYRYYFNSGSGSLFTIDRQGYIEMYKNTEWQRTISTLAAESQFVFPAMNDSLIFVSDKEDGKILVFNTISKKREHSHSFEIYPVKNLNSRMPEESNFFSITPNPSSNELYILDSVNRLKVLDIAAEKIHTLFSGVHPEMLLLTAIPNMSDSSVYGIAELQVPPYTRSAFYQNMKTGVMNIFSGGIAPYISFASSSGLTSKIRMVVSGINETELDLSNLTERSIGQFSAANNETILSSGNWENGYFQVIQTDKNETHLKVYISDSVSSRFMYQQNIRLKESEQLAAIFPSRKWYFTTIFAADKTIDNKLTVFDSSGKELKSFDVNMPVQTVNISSTHRQHIFSKDGSYFFIKEIVSIDNPLNKCRLRVIATQDLITLFDTSFAEPNDFNPFNHKTATFSDSSKGFYFITSPPNGNDKITNTLLYYSINGKKVFKEYETQLSLDPQNYIPATVRNISLSLDGKNLLWFGFAPADFINRREAYQFVVITDARSGKHFSGMNIPPMPELMKVLPLRDYYGLQFMDRIDFLQAFPEGPNHFLTVIPYINDNTYELSTIFLSPDYKENKNWYYEKTNNNDCISFKWGNQSYKRRQFDISYNRPDMVLGRIPGYDSSFQKLYFNAVNKRAERITGKLQNFKPEEMPVLTLKETKYNDNGNVAITVKIKSQYNINRFYVRINGNKTEKKLTSKIDKEGKGSESEWSFFEKLTQGENIIEITAVTELGIESMPLRLTQNHSKNPQKPNLFLLAVSVGKYKNGLTQLPFAVKDGRDVTGLFNQFRKDTMFNHVFIDSLFDDHVSTQAISKWIENKKDLSPSDYVIIFYSGHGFLDSSYSLRLATSFTDINSAEKNSIDYENILEQMDELVARQKLFLVDACHSGDFDKSSIKKDESPANTDGPGNAKGIKIKYAAANNSFEMMQNLFSFSEEGNGTVVISASGGTQSAYEAARYRNGFFTYALKEAIAEGKAANDPYNRLWLNQLVKYLRQRVTEMSGGKQVPNLRISNPDLNWRIK